MRIVAPKRRSSFGTDCVQCGDELIAPDRLPSIGMGCKSFSFWRCSKCDGSFELNFACPHQVRHGSTLSLGTVSGSQY